MSVETPQVWVDKYAQEVPAPLALEFVGMGEGFRLGEALGGHNLGGFVGVLKANDVNN